MMVWYICESVEKSKVSAKTIIPYYILPIIWRLEEEILIVFVNNIILTRENVVVNED